MDIGIFHYFKEFGIFGAVGLLFIKEYFSYKKLSRQICNSEMNKKLDELSKTLNQNREMITKMSFWDKQFANSQEKMANVLDEISKNIIKSNGILDRLLDRLQ